MMRSMFSGVSGLRAHQSRMDVIGNNIANVNTVGFKSSRVTFQEVFSQTLRGSSSPDANGRGGTNPMQVGLGISVASIDTIHTKGGTQRTDNPTDMAIDGQGFFIVKGDTDGAWNFTRAGNFGIDKLGNLTTPSGYKVYGWDPVENDGKFEFDTESKLVPINIYEGSISKRVIPAKETSRAKFSGNLDASLATNETVTAPFTIYDKLGNSHKVNAEFKKTAATADGTTWNVEFKDSKDNSMGAAVEISFDANGKIDSSKTTSFTVTATPDADTGTDPFDFDVNLASLTQFKGTSSVKATDVDGYSIGNLVNINIGSDGIITGIYSNGKQQPLCKVALAFFENAAGLEKVGENLYQETTNSGEFGGKGIEPGQQEVGFLSPGTLEMSNVDLSREFTDMITTQRGFQANSRIITTSDEMLQELVNLKR